MGIYGSPVLMQWFTSEFAKISTQKLDTGKSCMRFKKPNEIPYELIGNLMKKLTVQDWIAF